MEMGTEPFKFQKDKYYYKKRWVRLCILTLKNSRILHSFPISFVTKKLSWFLSFLSIIPSIISLPFFFFFFLSNHIINFWKPPDIFIKKRKTLSFFIQFLFPSPAFLQVPNFCFFKGIIHSFTFTQVFLGLDWTLFTPLPPIIIN